MAQDSVTVGVVNFAPVANDKAATLDKIEANVREAASQGIELLVFPEEALIGADACTGCLAIGGPCDTHVALAETIPGPATDRIARLARELDMYVIFGMAERDPVLARTLYNAAAVIAPDGVMGSYRKINPGRPHGSPRASRSHQATHSPCGTRASAPSVCSSATTSG